MKKLNPKLCFVCLTLVIAFSITSCKNVVYQVSVNQIDSIIKANGSVVIELKEGYYVYPLFGANDKLYHPGDRLRGELNPFLNLNPASAEVTGTGPWVCPKYCAIQITAPR